MKTLNPDWSPDGDTDADGTDYAWAYLHQGGRHDASLKLSHFRHRDLPAKRVEMRDCRGQNGAERASSRIVKTLILPSLSSRCC